jgi:hypothetical protein
VIGVGQRVGAGEPGLHRARAILKTASAFCGAARPPIATFAKRLNPDRVGACKVRHQLHRDGIQVARSTVERDGGRRAAQRDPRRHERLVEAGARPSIGSIDDS